MLSVFIQSGFKIRSGRVKYFTSTFYCLLKFSSYPEIIHLQDQPPQKSSRRPRADGERNRVRLIEAAKRAFAEKGASVALDHIARDADVSIATLYRHFPVRDDLISAVYQQEVTALMEAADRLINEQEPVTALHQWLILFVEFLATKHDIADVMDTLIGGPESVYSKTPHRLDTPITALVSRGVEAGVFREDIEPLDLLRALSGVAHVRAAVNWKQQALRMVDLLIGGLQQKMQWPER